MWHKEKATVGGCTLRMSQTMMPIIVISESMLLLCKSINLSHHKSKQQKIGLIVFGDTTNQPAYLLIGMKNDF